METNESRDYVVNNGLFNDRYIITYLNHQRSTYYPDVVSIMNEPIYNDNFSAVTI